jgi:hypothetical protein
LGDDLGLGEWAYNAYKGSNGMSLIGKQFLAFGLSFSIDYGTTKGLGRHDVDIPQSWLRQLRGGEYAFTILYVR